MQHLLATNTNILAKTTTPQNNNYEYTIINKSKV